MAEKTFEQALEELELLVKDLENGEIELNEAVKKYNDGMKLSKHCHDLFLYFLCAFRFSFGVCWNIAFSFEQCRSDII